MYILWLICRKKYKKEKEEKVKMNIVSLLELFVILLGVVLVYDARPITKKVFGFGDQNEGAKVLKITGFILTVIGGMMMLFI